MLIAVLIVTVALRLTQNTPWGRVLRAIREDEDAARALGKNAFAYKLQSLAISAAIAAVAGWFLALNLATIHPTDFEPLVTFFAYSVLILGGLANYWGVIVGSVILWTVLEGTARHPALQRRVGHGGAALRDRRPGPDPADGVPPAGHVRQEGGDGPW